MRIVAAAYLHDGVIVSLPAPARHHHIIWKLGRLPGRESGFLLDTGEFVDRKKAYAIAMESGQLREKSRTPGTLYSEDVW